MSSSQDAVRSVNETDRAAVERQLGRGPRGLRAIVARDAAGEPTVVCTHPRLPDGTPFPTLYYLTAPALVGIASTLEAEGLMRDMAERLAAEPELAERYRRAHEAYLAERDALEALGTDVSAGGMPDRVKCLHVHLAHTLASGPGINPFGDELVEIIAERWPAQRDLLGKS